MKRLRRLRFGFTAVLAMWLAGTPSIAQRSFHQEAEESAKSHPWMNPQLSPDERVEMVLKELTLLEERELLKQVRARYDAAVVS